MCVYFTYLTACKENSIIILPIDLVSCCLRRGFDSASCWNVNILCI